MYLGFYDILICFVGVNWMKMGCVYCTCMSVGNLDIGKIDVIGFILQNNFWKFGFEQACWFWEVSYLLISWDNVE